MGPLCDRGHRGRGDLGKGPAPERTKAEKPIALVFADFLGVFLPGLLGPKKTWASFCFFFFLNCKSSLESQSSCGRVRESI